MSFAPLAGWILIFLAIADIFLTVLYLRSGAGILSPLVAKGGWRLFLLLGRVAGRLRRTVLSLAGPVLLVLTAVTWSLFLTFGFALIYWPELGSGLQKSLGTTPTGFLPALYYSGFTVTTLGLGDVVPTVNSVRILTVLEAGLGFTFFTLTTTYILSVYSAIQRRNTLASMLEHMTSGTGDAASLVIDLGSGAWPSQVSGDLREIASRTADLLESHKFYPLLYYFHFLQNRYALPRMALILMDSVSLLKALPLPDKIRLKSSLSQLDTAGRNLLEHLVETFHPGGVENRKRPSDALREDWRRRFEETAGDLRRQGVDLPAELEEAKEAYVSLRSEWHPYIEKFTAALGYRPEEVFPGK